MENYKLQKYFKIFESIYTVRPLCIFLPKMSAYTRDFDETKYMSISIKDNKLLEKQWNWGKSLK